METPGGPSMPRETAAPSDLWTSTAYRGSRARGARAGVAVAWLAALLITPVLVLSGVYSALSGGSGSCQELCITPGEAFVLAAFVLGAIALAAFLVGTVVILALRTRVRTTGPLLGWGFVAGMLGSLPVLALFGRGFGLL